MTNIFVTEFAEFSEKIRKNSINYYVNMRNDDQAHDLNLWILLATEYSSLFGY